MMADRRLMQEIRRVSSEMVQQDGFGGWSTSERIAGALLNGRMDWLPSRYDHPVDAVIRLGPDWLAALCAAREEIINYG